MISVFGTFELFVPYVLISYISLKSYQKSAYVHQVYSEINKSKIRMKNEAYSCHLVLTSVKKINCYICSQKVEGLEAQITWLYMSSDYAEESSYKFFSKKRKLKEIRNDSCNKWLVRLVLHLSRFGPVNIPNCIVMYMQN